MSPRRHSPVDSWDEAADPALAYAMHQLDWYGRARSRARIFTQVGDLVILVSTAATVVVSAVHAPALVTASIAAVSLFLTGFRQVFHPNERWVRTGMAWMALQQAIVRYRLTPEGERDDALRQALIDRTVEITTAESQAWAEQRLGSPSLPVPDANGRPQ